MNQFLLCSETLQKSAFEKPVRYLIFKFQKSQQKQHAAYKLRHLYFLIFSEYRKSRGLSQIELNLIKEHNRPNCKVQIWANCEIAKTK